MDLADFNNQVSVDRARSEEEAREIYEKLRYDFERVISFIVPQAVSENEIYPSMDEVTLQAVWNGVAYQLEDGDFVGPYFFSSSDTALRGMAIYRKPSVNN